MTKKQCDICKRETNRTHNYKGYVLCSKHMHQLRRYGKFLDNIQRTNSDLNDYMVQGDIAVFNLYNQKNVKNGEFVIDIEDLEMVKYKKWRLSYGRVVTGNHTKKNPTIQLAHLLLGVLDTDYNNKIDHIDGDPLNNRKSNLRLCTQGQNTLNKMRVSNNTSGVIGVTKDRRKGRTNIWCAEIRCQKKRWHIGQYATIEEAAYARYVGECILFGEFRNTNKDEEKKQMFKHIPELRKQEIKTYVENKILS